MLLNRTSFRGVTAVTVTAGVISAALLGGGTAAGAAALSRADSADSEAGIVAVGVPEPTPPRLVPVKPTPKPKPKPKKAKPKPKPASRSYHRAALSGDPQTIAHSMVRSRGWSDYQFSCLQTLWNRESGWRVYASNGSSGAYGIPQALPGSKMASMGSDWRTNPVTQIRWGLWYISASYGTPCAALAHSYRYNYY
jgi:hypothetical protein